MSKLEDHGVEPVENATAAMESAIPDEHPINDFPPFAELNSEDDNFAPANRAARPNTLDYVDFDREDRIYEAKKQVTDRIEDLARAHLESIGAGIDNISLDLGDDDSLILTVHDGEDEDRRFILDVITRPAWASESK
jgi:hypothetical protein